MKKRLLTLLLAICFCLLTAVPVFAADGDPDIIDVDGLISDIGNIDADLNPGSSMTTAQNRTYSRVIDGSDLLSGSEEERLESELDVISNRQQFDVVVLTANTLSGKTPMEYADDYYDNNGYGYGEDRDGALLLVSMEDRDWWISTCGYGIKALTDYGIQMIGETVVSYLKDGEYYNCFSEFAQLCDEYVTMAKAGSPIDLKDYSDGQNAPYTVTRVEQKKAPFNFGTNILISLVIGFVAALIITGVMKSKLKTVRFQASANDYVNPGSLNVTKSQDLFLYSTVTRTAIPKETRSGGGGGGSSTHVSSSGSTHGGGGGKF